MFALGLVAQGCTCGSERTTPSPQPYKASAAASTTVHLARPKLGKLKPVASDLGQLAGIASAPDGSVVVSDHAGRRLLRVVPDAPNPERIRGGLGGPRGLAIDREGRIVVALEGDRKVVRVDAPKVVTVLDAFEGRPLNGPWAVALDDEGGLYVSDPRPERGAAPQGRDRLYFVAGDGSVRDLSDRPFDTPAGLAWAPWAKRLLATDRRRGSLYAFDPKAEGRARWSVIRDDLKDPRAIAVDAQGRIVVAHRRGLQVMTLDGHGAGRLHTKTGFVGTALGGSDGHALFAIQADGLWASATSMQARASVNGGADAGAAAPSR